MGHLNNPKALMILAISGLSILASCAGPESYQQKMARYTPKTIDKNQVPEIQAADFKFKTTMKETKDKATSGRAPASAPEIPNMNEDGKESSHTNKKLYFLTLFSEYESLKKYSMEFTGPAVSICPNFHTSLLRHNEKYSGTINGAIPKTRKFSYDSKRYTDETYLANRPELLLPLSKEGVTPKVIDIIRSSKETMNDIAVNDLVHKALDIHVAKTYSEIRELCELGVSDNYYIYENLITHIKSNQFGPDNKNLNTLLKTTIFSNIALMTSLEGHEKNAKTPGRSIASADSTEKKNSYVNEVMARLNVNWVGQYFEFIKASH